MADPQRIAARLQALWDIAHGPGGGADRPAYSAAEARAMQLVAGWAREAGLTPGVDSHGNLWGLPEQESAGLLTSGSHVDTVPDGGRYDGALGTALGLELVEDLRRYELPGLAPAILICAAEEAPRFGAGTVGSRLLIGALAPEDLEEISDRDGVTAAAALAEHLDRLADLPRITPPLGRLRGHAEVHVATRRALRELGVVSRVAAPNRLEILVTGEAGHAGEVAMDERRDALAAAAELIIAIETAARAAPRETVATVGSLEVLPGAMSVIPAHVRLGVDIRGVQSSSLRAIGQEIRRAADAVTRARGVEVAVRVLRTGDPAQMDPRLVDLALNAAQTRGIAATSTWSGSGHDAQHLARLVPALLLFVPLHGGESHTPAEGADMDEILDAAAVAADALAATVGQSPSDTSARPDPG